MEERVCRACGKSKVLKSFGLSTSGYRERVCSACRDLSKRLANPGRVSEMRRDRRARLPHTYIVQDSRFSDKKKGLSNDLDSEFVRKLIARGCHYCGESGIRMSLDRIDNTKGHLTGNVVPCCIRCNYLRGSMPYSAWLHLVPAIRETRELGLFDTWGSTPPSARRVIVTGV